MDNDHLVKPEGHLVLVTCGHRGQPNRAEEKRISRLLRKSGYIPMLEDITQQKKESEKAFDHQIASQEEEKKVPASGDASAQLSRTQSKGKGSMPNIKVVGQSKKSPLLDIVIDLEETVSPLRASQS